MTHKTDVDLWQEARDRFQGDENIQFPIDGKTYRLGEGAWIEARVWVDYEKEPMKLVLSKGEKPRTIPPGIYTDDLGNRVKIEWAEYDADAYSKALEEKVTK